MKKIVSVQTEQLKRKLQYVLVVLGLCVIPGLGYSQPTAPPGNGGIPDNPLSVPFDNHLNLLLLLAGVVFAIIVMVKAQKEKALTTLVK